MNIGILNNLKTKEILSTDDVKTFREYIKVKYPDCSTEKASVLLADAIRNIISNNIYHFDEKYKKSIIDSVIKRTAFKRTFSINGEEIFSSCLTMKIDNDDYQEALVEWVNENQDTNITQQEMSKIIEQLKHYDEEIIHYNLGRIINNISSEQESAVTFEVPEEKSDTGFPMLPRHLSISQYWNTFLKLSSDLAVRIKELNVDIKAATPVIALLICIIAFSIYGNSAVTVDSAEMFMEIELVHVMNNDKMLQEYLERETSYTQYIYKIEHELNKEFRYKTVKKEALKQWLKEKRSLLAEEPYFTTILEVSKKYDVNPLLMFAITGQEQSFVPKYMSNAKRIANNPFNVFGSWRAYNTSIKDSASIAAKTITKLSKDRPAYIDPIKWINRKYAEDQNWWKSVRSLYEQLKKEAM